MVAGLEVAFLVEDAVVWEEDLVVDANQGAVVGHGGGVEGLALSVHKANDHRHAARGGDDAVQAAAAFVDEVRLEEEVLGRIPGEGKLRECHQIGVYLPGPVDPLQDLGGVAFEVANGGVDLRHGQAKGSHDGEGPPWLGRIDVGRINGSIA